MFSVVPKVVQLAVYLKFRRRFNSYEVLFCKILVFAIVVPAVDMPQERQSLVTRPPVIMFAYMQYIHVSYLCCYQHKQDNKLCFETAFLHMYA